MVIRTSPSFLGRCVISNGLTQGHTVVENVTRSAFGRHGRHLQHKVCPAVLRRTLTTSSALSSSSNEDQTIPPRQSPEASSKKHIHVGAEPFYGKPRPRRDHTSNRFAPWGLLDCAQRVLSQPPPSPSAIVSTLSQHPFWEAVRAGKNDWSHRLALTWQHAQTAMQDPTRDDAVAAVGELTSTVALQHLQTVLQNHPVGREILEQRPVVGKDSLPYQTLLEGARNPEEHDDVTFGQAYGYFLKHHGFDPDERPANQYLVANGDNDAQTEELAYILLRYRQCHDFFHVLTGLPPTVVGELGLKWLELFQLALPLTAFSGTVGAAVTLQDHADDRRLLWHSYVPWAYRVGHQQMEFGTLLCVYYEREWETPLYKLRARMRVEPAPKQ